MRATITPRHGQSETGELLYSYTYPHAVIDKNGAIECFERRTQRCAVLTDDGRTWHFTVPLKVAMEGEAGT